MAVDVDAVVERVRPMRPELVDVAFGVALAAIGVIGFRTSFSGHEEMTVGLPAVVLGSAVGYLLAKLRAPLLVAVAAAVAVFFVLAAPFALRHHAIAGILPSPAAFAGLADGMINGWIRLLTTLPPAGRAGDLLAVPYLSGFAGGALAVGLAIRYPRNPVCVIPPALVLAISVLMGTKRPAHLVLQGAVFAALTIAWVSVRHRRHREINRGRLSPQRGAMALGLLGLAGIGGIVAGPNLPGAERNDRFVLRDEVEPPFDPLTEPSALAGFRNYTDQDVRTEEILTVEGLPRGGRIRIASMDEYDGLVWRSTGSGSVMAGQYLRVGADIPTDGFGEEHTVRVEIHRPHGVWVPLAGDVSSVDFGGPDAERLDEELRVSLASDTAAVPSALREGDRYTFTAEFVELPGVDDLRKVPLDGRFRKGEGIEVPEEFVRLGSEWAGSAQTAYAQLANIGEVLRTDGRYTDGGPDAIPLSPPGHSLGRLLQFLANDNPFGNGEQFAAAFGIMAQAQGLPARVVMGFVNEGGDDETTFTGEDIQAWVEIPVEGLGWVPVDGTPPEDQKPEPIVDPRTKQPNPEPQPPPPTTVPPPTSVPEELESEEPEEDEEEDNEGGGVPGYLLAALIVVGVPAVLLGIPAGLIVAAKARRRRRRRTTGPPSRRLSESFTELVDYARDTGASVPPKSTRVEVSNAVGTSGAVALAQRSDTAVFGPVDPTDVDIDAAWEHFGAARGEMVADMSRLDRLRAAVSLTSLRKNE